MYNIIDGPQNMMMREARHKECITIVCHIVIYNKKYIFGLGPSPVTEILKPLEFPALRVIKVSFAMLNR